MRESYTHELDPQPSTKLCFGKYLLTMRKGCFVCGIILSFFGLVLFVFLPVVNWIVYPRLEKLVILKYTDLKPENTDVWNAWVSDSELFS